MSDTIAFIGGGNMARALIGGALAGLERIDVSALDARLGVAAQPVDHPEERGDEQRRHRVGPVQVGQAIASRGPVVTPEHKARVEQWITTAEAEGGDAFAGPQAGELNGDLLGRVAAEPDQLARKNTPPIPLTGIAASSCGSRRRNSGRRRPTRANSKP